MPALSLPSCTLHPPLGHNRRPRHLPRAVAGEEGTSGPPAPQSPTTTPAEAARRASAASAPATPRRRKADSTDPITSALTRRFGLAGGLAWAAVLTAGVVSEQVKTRIEGAAAAANTAAVADAPPLDLRGGVIAQDLRIGGGERPRAGLLAVLEVACWPSSAAPSAASPSPAAAVAAAAAAGAPYFDTKDTGKPLVLLVGGRPLTGGLCPGAEAALLGMRAGGKRLVLVPAAAGFGTKGTQVRPTRHSPDKDAIIPPGADLVYSIELLRVSVPPS